MLCVMFRGILRAPMGSNVCLSSVCLRTFRKMTNKCKTNLAIERERTGGGSRAKKKTPNFVNAEWYSKREYTLDHCKEL
jgi:hypothetical protein